MARETPRTKRKSIIKEIEKKRGSKVITYITSDRPNLNVQIAEDVIRIVNEHLIVNKINENSKIDLFIYSRGGDADVPWAFVSMIREYTPKGSFNVLIPYKAHSAATLISLGADEIIMSKKGELGPIDATISNSLNNPVDPSTNQRIPISVEDVTGYFNLLAKFDCSRSEEKMIAFKELTNRISPLALGSVNRLLDQTKLVATRLLETRKHNKYTNDEIKEIVKKISSEIYSHRHAINRTEATNYLKLKNILSSEEANIDKEMWDLYVLYEELFQFNSPFTPEQYLLENNLDEFTWSSLNLACIESVSHLDICKKSMKLKQLKTIPPQVTLNLNNISLPAINLPPIPQNEQAVELQASLQKYLQNVQVGIQQYLQNITQVLQPLINQASENVAKEFLKALPSQGFQRIDLNSGWVKTK